MYTKRQVMQKVRKVLGDLPKPYAIGTSVILMERLPELTKQEVFRAFGIIINRPSYDKLVIRSDVAFGLDGWTQIITEDRKQWHQRRIDKLKLKKANRRLHEQHQRAAAERKAAEKAKAQEPVEKPVEGPRKAPVIQFKRKRRIVKPEAFDGW